MHKKQTKFFTNVRWFN